MTVVLKKSPWESAGYLQRATYKAEDFLEEEDISKKTKGNFDGGKLWSIAAYSASTTNSGPEIPKPLIAKPDWSCLTLTASSKLRIVM